MAPGRLIQASATMQRLGAWRIDLDPTAGGLREAFGPWSSCRPINLGGGSIIRYNTLGIRVVTALLAEIPPGMTSCTYPRMRVYVVTVTGKEWHTSFGLRVGDTVATLRPLYPHASFHARGWGDAYPRDSFSLVTQRTACLGDRGAAHGHGRAVPAAQ
jgi:hypothetical protein